MLTVLIVVIVVQALFVAFAVALGRASAAGDGIKESWAEYFEVVAAYELEELAPASPRGERFARRRQPATHGAPGTIGRAAA